MSAQHIFGYNANSRGWTQIPERTGPNRGWLKQVQHLGTERGEGNIYQFNLQAQNWELIPGSNLSQIAVGFDGTVWGINSASQIFR